MIQTGLFIPHPPLPRAPPNTLHRARRIDFQGIFAILFRFLGDQGRGISLSRTKCCESWHTPVLCIGWVQMQRIFSACRCSSGCQEHTRVHTRLFFTSISRGFFTSFCFHFIHIIIPQSMSDQGDFLLLHSVSIQGTVLYLVARYQNVFVKYVPPC